MQIKAINKRQKESIDETAKESDETRKIIDEPNAKSFLHLLVQSLK